MAEVWGILHTKIKLENHRRYYRIRFSKSQITYPHGQMDEWSMDDL